MGNPERSAYATRPAARAARDDIAATGAAAFRDARASVEGAMADVGERGKEALQSARDVRDTFADALLESLETRPYATLAVVAGLGFLAGAIWRR
jgi:ElaB/YqjD/DUF883 family membrane-anchored ribosome-binding protein